MKCHKCKKEINEFSDLFVITEPDGDPFHKDCLTVWKKERDYFFDKILPDDKLFKQWLNSEI